MSGSGRCSREEGEKIAPWAKTQKEETAGCQEELEAVFCPRIAKSSFLAEQLFCDFVLSLKRGRDACLMSDLEGSKCTGQAQGLASLCCHICFLSGAGAPSYLV